MWICLVITHESAIRRADFFPGRGEDFDSLLQYNKLEMKLGQCTKLSQPRKYSWRLLCHMLESQGRKIEKCTYEPTFSMTSSKRTISWMNYSKCWQLLYSLCINQFAVWSWSCQSMHVLTSHKHRESKVDACADFLCIHVDQWKGILFP